MDRIDPQREPAAYNDALQAASQLLAELRAKAGQLGDRAADSLEPLAEQLEAAREATASEFEKLRSVARYQDNVWDAASAVSAEAWRDAEASALEALDALGKQLEAAGQSLRSN